MQTTQARFVSGFGWGLTKRIESHGLNKFKANVQRVWNAIISLIYFSINIYKQSREGVSLVLRLLRESRLQPLVLGSDGTFVSNLMASETHSRPGTWTRMEDKSPPKRSIRTPAVAIHSFDVLKAQELDTLGVIYFIYYFSATRLRSYHTHFRTSPFSYFFVHVSFPASCHNPNIL